MFSKKVSTDSLADNSVEKLKVISIELLLDNGTYNINNINENFDDLPFDGNERFISRQQLYRINDDIVFRLINVSSFYV